MRKRSGGGAAAIAIAALALMAGAAAAQTQHYLSEQETRAALLGADMSGTHEAGDVPWRECIDPGGATVYWMYGRRDIGRLSVRPDGQACYSYQSSNYAREACWRLERRGDQLRFTQPGDAQGFITVAIRRGVRSCSGDETPIS